MGPKQNPILKTTSSLNPTLLNNPNFDPIIFLNKTELLIRRDNKGETVKIMHSLLRNNMRM